MVHNPYKSISKERANELKKILLAGSCTTPCSCDNPKAIDIPSLPFHRAINSQSILPGTTVNASFVLKLKPRHHKHAGANRLVI